MPLLKKSTAMVMVGWSFKGDYSNMFVFNVTHCLGLIYIPTKYYQKISMDVQAFPIKVQSRGITDKKLSLNIFYF